MSDTSNKALIKRWFDCVWNGGDACSVESFLAPDCVHEGILPTPVTGPKEFRAFHKGINDAVADVTITIEDMIEDGDKVAGHFTVTGTHRKTGQDIRFTSHFFARCKDGKVIHTANEVDYLGLLTQLGEVSPDAMNKAMS
ncbi:MAG: hypothetical protein Alpg2KO_24110 [Alphaproteobacteria bacterium]